MANAGDTPNAVKVSKQSYISISLAVALGLALLTGGSQFGSMSQRLVVLEDKMHIRDAESTKLDSVDRRQGILMAKMDGIEKQMDRIIDKLDEDP